MSSGGTFQQRFSRPEQGSIITPATSTTCRQTEKCLSEDSSWFGRLLGLAKNAGLGVFQGFLSLSSAKGVCLQWGLGPSESTARKSGICPLPERDLLWPQLCMSRWEQAVYPCFLSGLWLKTPNCAH